LLGEQASELLWNDRDGRWLQRRSLLVHLSPFPAKPGMAEFRIEFRDFPRPTGEGATRRPDVFLFIVETLRLDAIRPEITPFLARWAEAECQEIRHSRAASNATHLSWFTILGGKPALLWDRDRRLVRPAPMLESLKALGYRTEVRSAAAYDYMQMESTNFGRGEATDFMMNKRVNPATWPRGSSACDLHVLRHWQAGLPNLPSGPVFQINDIESPHYPYYWLESDSFTPPHADYFRSLNFPFMPGKATVRLVRNRYENSVAFVDHLLETYLSGLRQAGRYDDALIIVTGDHGDELQENGFWFHTTGLTPQQTAVPLLIKWPRAMGRGRPVPEAGHMDILPSVLQALGCPPGEWSGMAGRALHEGGEATTLVTSYYASQNGEGMIWRRGGYEAAFGWRQIWVHRRPATVWLERLNGPGGAIHPADAAEADALLREFFPDAVPRWFSRFELLGES
jgi:membrane-anchored protein YejM (alkaline phosphatase superfamily)